MDVTINLLSPVMINGVKYSGKFEMPLNLAERIGLLQYTITENQMESHNETKEENSAEVIQEKNEGERVDIDDGNPNWASYTTKELKSICVDKGVKMKHYTKRNMVKALNEL